MHDRRIRSRCDRIAAALPLWITYEPPGANRRRSSFARSNHPHFHASFVTSAADVVNKFRLCQHVGWRRRLEPPAQREIRSIGFARRVNRATRQQRTQLRVDVRSGAPRFWDRRADRRRRRRLDLDRPNGCGDAPCNGAGTRARRWSAARPRPGCRTRCSRDGRSARRAWIRHAGPCCRRDRGACQRGRARRRCSGGARHGCGGRRGFRHDRGGRCRSHGRLHLRRRRPWRWLRGRRRSGRGRRRGRRRHLYGNRHRRDGRYARGRRRYFGTRLRFEDILRWLRIRLRRLLWNWSWIGGRVRNNFGQLVAINREALRLRLRQRSVTNRRDRRHVRHRRNGTSRGRLICNDDRRRSLNRHDLATRDAFGCAFLRGAAQN